MEKGRLKGEDGSGKAGRRDGKETNEVRWMEGICRNGGRTEQERARGEGRREVGQKGDIGKVERR